jgi:plastocyanin
MSRISPLTGLIVAAALAIGACSGASSPTAAPASAPASAAPASAAGGGGGGTASAVTIQNFAFNPATISVKVGTKVTWTNQDSAGHTVTFDTGSDTSDTLAQGATYDHTFDAAGSFAYHCKIHPTMKGTVTVTQ